MCVFITGKAKPDSRGQHVNINDLLEQAEDDENKVKITESYRMA